jgi:phosphopantothenoylcysteine decarboxylase/phosphopantothenate--cysteine ligase
MRFLITAGGTREYLDPVRFLSNASSGRMGYALARAALQAGHQVTLITTPTALKPPAGARVIAVESAAQMFRAVKEHFLPCDCLIMAAAVADYTPAHPSRTKLKKQAGKLTLELKPTPDILKWAGRHKRAGWGLPHRKPPVPSDAARTTGRRARIIVGFALEDKDLRANAERKMREKHLDIIVANSPGAIGAETSTLYIRTAGSGWVEITNARKTASAGRILRVIDAYAQQPSHRY